MRILLLANNWVGLKVAEFLRSTNDSIVGVVMHPPSKQKYGEQILATLGLSDNQVFDGSSLREQTVLDTIAATKPEMGVSILFDYILHASFLNLFPAGVINLHPSYLPYNRGNYPNVWSILEGTPAGVTLHYIDTGVDTGDIIAQREVGVEITDTGETLYRKLERECTKLFEDWWPRIVAGQITPQPQPEEQGTYHRAKDVQQIDRIELDASYRAMDLINILRARTFPPYDGAYFIYEGEKVYMRLELYKEGENVP